MKDIYLAQIERSDLSRIREFFNYGFKRFLNEHRELNRADLELWWDRVKSDPCACFFAIRGSADVYKDFLVGVCGLQNIDWTARHAEIFFVMVDKDGHKATMHNRPDTRKALSQLLSFGFRILNLNKIWIEAYEHNDIRPILENFGFVAEGVRKDALFKEGRYWDSVICSLLREEWEDEKK